MKQCIEPPLTNIHAPPVHDLLQFYPQSVAFLGVAPLFHILAYLRILLGGKRAAFEVLGANVEPFRQTHVGDDVQGFADSQPVGAVARLRYHALQRVDLCVWSIKA